MILNSYAKLNLYLEVLNKRPDDCHNIKTLFERIGLADRIILKPLSRKIIKIICPSAEIPCGRANLAYRAAKLLQDKFKVNKGVEIKITKRIPVGAGLGGGSSNAAAVLLGLNKLWKIGLGREKLSQLAGKIGCDVPFFIYNCSFAWGRERGDKIKPVKAARGLRLWHILVVPKINVATAKIYQKWERYSYPNVLTATKVNAKMLLQGKGLFNALEEVTLKLYPQVRRIKEKLAGLGVKSILMSGSGPAVFGIVSSRKEAVALSRQLKKRNRSWQVFVTRAF